VECGVEVVMTRVITLSMQNAKWWRQWNKMNDWLAKHRTVVGRSTVWHRVGWLLSEYCEHGSETKMRVVIILTDGRIDGRHGMIRIWKYSWR
jgi:hypothetical protein